jgi:hypothetical protein
MSETTWQYIVGWAFWWAAMLWALNAFVQRVGLHGWNDLPDWVGDEETEAEESLRLLADDQERELEELWQDQLRREREARGKERARRREDRCR